MSLNYRLLKENVGSRLIYTQSLNDVSNDRLVCLLGVKGKRKN